MELVVTSFLVSFLIHVLNEIFDIYPSSIFMRVMVKVIKNNYPLAIFCNKISKEYGLSILEKKHEKSNLTMITIILFPFASDYFGSNHVATC